MVKTTTPRGVGNEQQKTYVNPHDGILCGIFFAVGEMGIHNVEEL